MKNEDNFTVELSAVFIKRIIRDPLFSSVSPTNKRCRLQDLEGSRINGTRRQQFGAPTGVILTMTRVPVFEDFGVFHVSEPCLAHAKSARPW